MDGLQLLLNAVALGAAYALVALGFVLILNATTAVNFAHGETVVAGGFLAIALTYLVPEGWRIPGIVLLPAVLILMAGFGAVMAWLVYLPIRAGPPVSVFVTTIAFGIIVTNGLNAVFGAAPQSTPPLLGGGYLEIGELRLARQSAAIIVTATILIGGFSLLLGRTQLGRRMRACAQDPDMARAVGIDLTAMIVASFALAAALAGTAGLLLANQFFLTPNDGGLLILKAYIAVTIGGWGSMRGAVAGAMLIALFEVVAARLLSQPLAEGLLYLAIFAVLLLRPQGMFGEHSRRRA